MEDLVSNEFTNVTLDYAVLFMASPKCAVNPHLRKDIGPLYLHVAHLINDEHKMAVEAQL